MIKAIGGVFVFQGVRMDLVRDRKRIILAHKMVCVVLLSLYCVVFSIFSGNLGVVVNAETDTSKWITEKCRDGDIATGVGLASWAVNAYKEKWGYTWGSSSASSASVDCAGLINSYRGVGGIRSDMNASATYKGLVDGTLGSIPRVHGLGLSIYSYERGTSSGHVGVFLGSTVSIDGVEGCIIDSSGGTPNMLLGSGADRWVHWFRVSGVEYPYSCFIEFEGNLFYYASDGEYVVSGGGTKDMEVTVKMGDKSKKVKIQVDENGVVTRSKNITADMIWASATSKGSGTATIGGMSGIGSGDVAMDFRGGTGEDGATVSQQSSKDVIERSLSFDEYKRVEEINRSRESEDFRNRWSLIFTLFSFCGVVVMMYSLVLVLAFYLDIFNPLTEISLFNKLTFGVAYPLAHLEDEKFVSMGKGEGKGVKFISHKGVWTIFVIGVLASAVMLQSQTFIIYIMRLWGWIQSTLQSFG